MDLDKENDKSPGDSLDLAPPNPYDAPVTPLTPLVKKAGIEAALFTAAGAGALFLLAGTMTPCVGATRSARLKWEERQCEIEQAEHDAESSDSEKQD